MKFTCTIWGTCVGMNLCSLSFADTRDDLLIWAESKLISKAFEFRWEHRTIDASGKVSTDRIYEQHCIVRWPDCVVRSQVSRWMHSDQILTSGPLIDTETLIIDPSGQLWILQTGRSEFSKGPAVTSLREIVISRLMEAPWLVINILLEYRDELVVSDSSSYIAADVRALGTRLFFTRTPEGFTFTGYQRGDRSSTPSFRVEFSDWTTSVTGASIPAPNERTLFTLTSVDASSLHKGGVAKLQSASILRDAPDSLFIPSLENLKNIDRSTGVITNSTGQVVGQVPPSRRVTPFWQWVIFGVSSLSGLFLAYILLRRLRVLGEYR
jgi:hypothetical protein